jgi:peptidoglycan/xylan/chitin deacetylase (PgdA/CDA1 family)
MRHRQHEWARFPDWPLDLSADFVADWSNADPSAPIPRPTAVALTHDIDSLEGLRNLVDKFLPLEEAVGARSSNFIVPCAWRLDHGLLREIMQRGHEIGVHGYDHSNRTPFVDAKERRQRLKDGFEALAEYSPVGYRAPSLLRTEALVNDLAEYCSYDSSIPTSGGPFPSFNNGCATARPFRLGRTIEVPISLRRDGTVRFLGYTPATIGAMWKENAEEIARARGVVVLLTHCEKRFTGNPAMLAAYEDFLHFAKESTTFRWSTAADVARDAIHA